MNIKFLEIPDSFTRNIHSGNIQVFLLEIKKLALKNLLLMLLMKLISTLCVSVLYL